MAVAAAMMALIWVGVVDASFDIRQHLSSSTPYGDRWRHSPAPGVVGECRLRQISMVVRHGSRYPTRSKLRLYRDVRQRVQQLLGSRSWMPDDPFDDALAGHLTVAGLHEQFELGRRIRERHPDLFASAYHPERCRLRSTQKHRAGQSASAMAYGLN
ncbi:Acid phosphatase [Plasmodiophora brassicae]|uniref:Multiple inositol polyphosphate phosphatase 1 n=1 Tax=Plasmodiophora brassicae TaxID=37360 RepID=A0A3P3YMY8_PLABS|nr:unnamed protein product [Plasmodiophora brassicae]